MPMPVPEERVYYHELRECGKVLLCWMPRQELRRLVDEGKVNVSVLKDHPNGVDVEVTPADFAYYKRRYRIDIGLRPEDLLLAFEATAASSEVEVSGEIRGAVIEELARQDEAEEAPEWDARRPVALEQAQVVLQQHPAVQRRVDEGLRSIRSRVEADAGSAPGIEAAAPQDALRAVMQQVRRSEGENEVAVFSRLQRRAREKR
jgi:hypothetical protein